MILFRKVKRPVMKFLRAVFSNEVKLQISEGDLRSSNPDPNPNLSPNPNPKPKPNPHPHPNPRPHPHPNPNQGTFAP